MAVCVCCEKTVSLDADEFNVLIFIIVAVRFTAIAMITVTVVAIAPSSKHLRLPQALAPRAVLKWCAAPMPIASAPRIPDAAHRGSLEHLCFGHLCGGQNRSRAVRHTPGKPICRPVPKIILLLSEVSLWA
eukprot:scaffold86169_cov31-Prasinocladus_malaysianus.AAC.1